VGQESGKRKAGRPHEKVIGPKELEQIGEMLAEGIGIRRIGETLGVDHATIHYHIERHISPLLRQPALRGPEHLLNKYEHLFKVCWQHFRANAPCETKEQLEQVVDAEGKAIPGRLKKEITKTFRPGQIGWLQLAFSVLQEISRLLRYTTAGGDTINILNTGTSVQGEFRRAGANWSQINAEVVERLQKLIEDQSEYDAAAKMFLESHDVVEEGP